MSNPNINFNNFISYLESKGFINETMPDYKVESCDEFHISIAEEPEYLVFSKKWLTISVLNRPNEEHIYLKCKLKDTTVIPYRIKEYTGNLVSYSEKNRISLEFSALEYFGPINEIASSVGTYSEYKISLPDWTKYFMYNIKNINNINLFKLLKFFKNLFTLFKISSILYI